MRGVVSDATMAPPSSTISVTIVVGIVTAILNPTPARTFIGIGFAVPIENAASAVGMSPF